MQQICNRFQDDKCFWCVPINYLLAKKLWVKIKDLGYLNADVMIIQSTKFVKYTSDRINKSLLYKEDDVVYFVYKQLKIYAFKW